MAHEPMEHLPAETILADLRTSVAGGEPCAVSSSEDFFRYGASGSGVNFPALAGLLERMADAAGDGFMQIDHGNIASVLQFSDAELRTLRRLLSWGRPVERLWVNLGVESANGRLVQANGPGKIAPYRAEDWPEMVLECGRRLSEAGFMPLYSLVLGLPGETPADVTATRRLMDEVMRGPGVTFPVFHEPPSDRGGAFGVDTMTPEHFALFRECYERNFRRVPALIWDNQRAGGVSWTKRVVMQLLGRGEVFTWRRSFARIGRRVARRAAPAPHSAETAAREPG
jgi:hypothetical protein